MKLPKFRLLKATDTTAEAIEKDLAALDRAVVDAETEMHRLGSIRQDLLLHGTDDALVAHDATAAKVRAMMEQAQARREALQPEWEAAQARETAERDQEERAALYKEATAGDKERQRLYLEYASQAQKIAAALRRIDELDTLVFRANESRPDGAAAIGFHMPGNRPFNGFLTRVSLPSVATDGPAFWSGKNAAGPALSAEQRWHLDYHNVP